jgi:hypothetical protein
VHAATRRRHQRSSWEALVERDDALVSTQAALASLQREFGAYRAQRKREDAERAASTREQLQGLTTERDTAAAGSKRFEESLDAVRGELTSQLTECPPGAFEAMRQQCARLEATIQQLEMKNVSLRRDAARWRDRARGAIASERLLQMQSGSAGMVPPARDEGGRLTRTLSSATETDEVDEAVRLRAESEYWRAEAEHEQQRQKAFQEVLWASDAFSLVQKQKMMTLLRDPPSIAAGGDVDLEELLTPRTPRPGTGW